MKVRSFIKSGAVAISECAGTAIVALVVHPPDLLQAGANFSAKLVCSNVFLAARDEKSVPADDVRAPGHPLLNLGSRS